MTLWRISNHESLSGEGGLRYSARWHTAGRRIVYLAESPAGAMMEALVHLELDQNELPRSYTLLQIKVPANLPIRTLSVPPSDTWHSDLALTRRLGDQWLLANESALTRVPSAILPGTFNVLLNPTHPDAPRLEIETIVRPKFDPRLLRSLRD